MHVVNHPRPWRAKRPAGPARCTELLSRFPATAVVQDDRILQRVTAVSPAAAPEYALEAGA